MNFRDSINLFIMAGILLGGITAMNAQQKKKLTLEDIFSSDKFRGKTVSDIQWLPDGSAFTFTRQNDQTGALDIYRHNVATGKETLILDGGSLIYKNTAPLKKSEKELEKPDDVAKQNYRSAAAQKEIKIKMSAYQTTGNQNHLLITGAQKQIWRHSFRAPYYLYDIEDRKLTALANNDPALQNVTISPDGKKVAYIKNNNLYVADVETGQSKPLTSDGSLDILNGIFDWVYEEEFGRADAYRWSLDGKKIAFWRTDQTRVKTFTLLDELPFYSTPSSLKYPKVGEQNAIVKTGVVDIESGKIVWMDLGENDDIYIPRIEWTNSPNTLALQRLNRKQNHLELLFGDVKTGITRVILEDSDEAWIDVSDDFVFLRNTDQIIWTSEKSGFRHIYLSDYRGKQIAQLTAGDWEVSSVIGADEKDGWVYFYGKKESPGENDIYRVDINSTELYRLSKDLNGWHTANFSPDFQFYVGSSSNVKTPTQVALRKSDGSLVRILEENKIKALDGYSLVFPEFFSIKTSDGVELNALMIKPANFDSHKKYPVLVYGYGGPGSQIVINRWGMGSKFRHLQQTLWHQLLTEKGYIVFTVDNRGTGGRGKAFKNLSYGDLSRWSVNDQIEGAKYLANLPYVDANRIGFWGWSGGGYLSCMLLTRAADYFKTGIAVAPVSDFRNYDTIWTERYMGLLSENETGYKAANANNYAHLLKGKLLIVHGSGDDNVHLQNSLQFVDKLISKNKQFDMMIYPNRNHRINGGNTSRHLFTKFTHYILENL